jgi:outer membrane protein assembly factor BamB
VLAGSAALIGGCLGSASQEPPADESRTPSPTVTPIQFETATSDGPTGGHWPQFGYDAANTGHQPAGPVPTGSVTERWRVSVPGYNSPHAPVLDDGRLVVQSGRTEVASYDVSNGARRWIRDIGGRTYGFSPAVRDGLVFVAASERGAVVGETETPLSDGLHALSMTDGATEWANDVRVLSSPVLADDDLVVATEPAESTKAIVRYDPADGTERWRYTCADGCSTLGDERHIQPMHIHRPAVAGDTIYVASVDESGRGHLRAVDADGSEVWVADFDKKVVSPPVIGAELIFLLVDGSLRAVDPSTGAVRWQRPLPSKDNYSSHLIPVTDGTTVYTTGASSVLAFAAADGTERWRYETGDEYQSTLGPRMAVSDAHLVVAFLSMVAIDTDTGDPIWEFEHEDAHHVQYTGPVLADGGVVMASCLKQRPSDYYTISVHQLSA